MVEITISIKTSEATYKKKFLVYETLEWCENDTMIRKLIKEAQQDLKIDAQEIESIKVRSTLEIS